MNGYVSIHRLHDDLQFANAALVLRGIIGVNEDQLN
jgi:hypothetical protein